MKFFDQLNEFQQKEAISHAFQELVLSVVVGDIDVPGVTVPDEGDLVDQLNYVSNNFRNKLMPWAEAAAEGSQYDEEGNIIYEISA